MTDRAREVLAEVSRLRTALSDIVADWNAARRPVYLNKSELELVIASLTETADCIANGFSPEASAPQPMTRTEAQTPAARWRDAGEPDPHGNRYLCDRRELCGGDMTDDELANEVYGDPSLVNLTAAKDRIRWLSRQLARLVPSQPDTGTKDYAPTIREVCDAIDTALAKGESWVTGFVALRETLQRLSKGKNDDH